jgi:hypothetical protein
MIKKNWNSFNVSEVFNIFAICLLKIIARMAELVDAHDSNSCSIGVSVRFRLRVQVELLEIEALFCWYRFLKIEIME